ncbi:hypothetical protein MHO82_25435 [Vibrio sp. Of7-15]|uniref:TolB family protein n=1 Tax=Vibrio sp. Of7-15 TaxID=2724879 RepID=UPI001EF1F5D7|nr:hypothetical protein [Vibrio sp. Of7-15]MCG7500198.1 hypothetical protein [Vibrio sp. Of7-15]
MKMRGICLVLAGLLLAGCEPSAPPAQKTKVEAAPEWSTWPTLSSGPRRGYELRYNERAIPQRRVMVGEHNSIVYYKHGLVSYDIPKAAEWPREDLNDKSAYEQPRIAFVWANRENGDDYETKTKVWSKKLDGTDLRLVYDKGVSFGRDVVISPNGKYLAAISEDNEDFLLIDIATGEERKLNDFPGKTYFSWTSDSRYLFFGDFNAYKRFDVETNTIEDFSDLKRGMYMQFIGDKRVVVNAFGYQILWLAI